MPRAALRGLWAGLVLALAVPASGIDPHMDPGLVRATCAACHEGHGSSRSPMLPGPQAAVCLSCHDTRGGVDQQVMAGVLAGGASPPLLSSALSQPFVHPLDADTFSRWQPGVVTCTSCHSPHRALPGAGTGGAVSGRRKPAPNDPRRFEFELCQGCHGSAGNTTRSLVDSSRLFNPTNRSFHPVEAPSLERSPSVATQLAGREINCSDCHGNSDPGGARGPHGSAVRYILRAAYATTDGSPESPAAYALCYTCHVREAVLELSAFPEHGEHVADYRASCATCHSAHGSVDNRALIRFGEETFLGAVAPSASTGRLAFVSTGAGSGACYLTCHGRDHAPGTYGGFAALP